MARDRILEGREREMKKILSPWRNKRGLEDPCIILDRALFSIRRGDFGEAVKLFWKAACTNIAMIPRLALWEEPETLGDEQDQGEAWEYMNSRWHMWEEDAPFTALSIFWSHFHVRAALGLHLIKKTAEKDSPANPDFGRIAGDIHNVLEGNSPNERLTRKAVLLCLNMASIMREIDRKGVTPPRELIEELAEIDTFTRGFVEFYSLEKSADKDLPEMGKMLDKLGEIQKALHTAIKLNHKL